jgi:hypothetical protein
MAVAARGSFSMAPGKDTHGKLQVRCDYVCVPIGCPDTDSVTALVEKSLTETDDAPAMPADVADRRRAQQLLSASLQSFGSIFIFSAPPTPRSDSQESRSHLRLSLDGHYVRVVRIEEIEVHLGDDTALLALLASVPWPALVGPLLHKPFFGRRWDFETKSDHWLASDGATVMSLRVSGASAAAVARLRTRFDDLRLASPGLLPSHGILHDLLEDIAREDNQAAT